MSEMLVLQSFWEKGLKTGDDMAFGPKGECVMDVMECKTLVTYCTLTIIGPYWSDMSMRTAGSTTTVPWERFGAARPVRDS